MKRPPTRNNISVPIVVGITESVIEKEMKKVHFSKKDQKPKKVEKGVPFVVTHCLICPL